MKHILSFLIVLNSFPIVAQSIGPSVINSAGTTFSTSDIILEFSTGEVAVSQHVTSQIIISEGLLEGDFFSVTGFDSVDEFDLEFYPNPTSDLLNVLIHDNNKSGTIHLFHQSGIVMIERPLSPGEQSIQFNLSGFKDGLYYLRILSTDGKNQSVHKIIFSKQ